MGTELDRREAQAFYDRLLLDECPSVFAMFDRDYRFVTGTAKLIVSIFDGIFADNLPSMHFSAIFEVSVEHSWIEETLANCETVLRRGEALHYTDCVPYINGRRVYVGVTIAPVTEAGGTLGFLLLMHDVTELVFSKEVAMVSSRAKSGFLSALGHELRGPVADIAGVVGRLAATTLDGAQKAYLRELLRASGDLEEIMGGVLDVIKVDAEKMDISIHEYRLVTLIRDMAERMEQRAREKGLDFVLDVDPTLPSGYLGDDLRIKQILLCLFESAVNHTNASRIILRVEYESLHGQAVLFFRVAGAGIPPERMSTLFDEPLEPGEDAPGGVISFAAARKLAHVMDGDVSAENESGWGSVLTFSLPQPVARSRPIAEVQNPAETRVLVLGGGRGCDALLHTLTRLFVQYAHVEEQDFLTHIERHSCTHIIFWCKESRQTILENMQRFGSISLIAVCERENGEPPGGAAPLYEPIFPTELVRCLNVRVKPRPRAHAAQEPPVSLGALHTENVRALVVDDNEINLMVAEEILRQYDIEATLAESGPDAIALCETNAFDVIFMDHMMPEMDGVEAAAGIRALGGAAAAVPIIALTANAEEDSRDFFLKNQMDDYLAKPIDAAELDGVLRRWLPQEKIRQSAARQSGGSYHAFADQRLVQAARHCPIDVGGALVQIGGSETAYIHVLEAFVGTAGAKCEELRRYVKEEKWEAFRIEVHSQKSALANIGATGLSESARKMELAASSRNFAYIPEHIDAYLAGVESLRAGILDIFPPDVERAERPVATEEMMAYLPEEAERIIGLIDALEHSDALEAIAALRAYTYGEKNDRRLTDAQEAVYHFDYDKAAARLGRIQ